MKAKLNQFTFPDLPRFPVDLRKGPVHPERTGY